MISTPHPIHHPYIPPISHFHPPPHLTALVVSGPLTAVGDGITALVVRAHRIAMNTCHLVTDLVVEAEGRDACFAVFARGNVQIGEATVVEGGVRGLEAQLAKLRERQPLTSLEWAVVNFGQAYGKPESARGSFVSFEQGHP